jgi:cupin 2 domain-containing protein
MTSPFLRTGNLFEGAQPPATGERFETLLSHRQLQVERIVSSDRTEPVEFVQPQDEWVLLVKGSALLEVAGAPVALEAGDHLFIPAGVPHTVRRTSQGALWVAVHLHP